jgi:leader peptidase (prepilin peptidase)/N-methyltransferase
VTLDITRLLPIALVVVAPFIGSFLSVVVTRLVRGKTVVAGRSACDACGHPLGVLDLVPLASFAALRGRCRHCGAAIDPVHPALEIGALGVALWAALTTGDWLLVATCVLGWTLLALAAIDLRDGLLPDVLTFPLLGIGLAVSYGIDPALLVDHIIGAATGFTAFAALAYLYRRLRGREGLGLGDAKLLAAEGAWVGWIGLPTIILFAAVIGLIAVLVQSRRGRVLAATDRLPFGPALAFAGWLVWLYGPLIPG